MIDCSPYRGLHVRCELFRRCASFKAILCRPGAKPYSSDSHSAARSEPSRARCQLIDNWKKWMTEQMGQAKLEEGQAVYLSLRMDGRVRGSGTTHLPAL
jgi:hypothetical protein